MPEMELMGYIAALCVGMVLGLIGSGGSILIIPVLVYMLGIEPVPATAYSLFVVGTAAIIGTINSYRKDLLSVRTALVFAVPSMIGVYLTRYFVVPAIPDRLFALGDLIVTRHVGIMVFFALIMLIAAFAMIREGKESKHPAPGKPHHNYVLIMTEGIVVGIITGLVGAGGGFLIIPALVILGKLPMKTAVGTSLMIIALKSLFGFMGDLQNGMTMDWQLLLIFTTITVIGIFTGGYLSNYISANRLKRGFGWFVLVMSVFILTRELVLR